METSFFFSPVVVLQLTIVASPFPTHPVQCFVCIHCLSKVAFAAALGSMHKEPATESRGVGLAFGALEVPACQLEGFSGEVLPEDHRWACCSRTCVPLML